MNRKMNRKAIGPNLTTLVIGIVLFIGILILVFSPEQGIYSNFIQANDEIVNPAGDINYSTLNLNERESNLTSFTNRYTGETGNTLTAIASLPRDIFLTIASGANALKLFLEIPAIITGFVNSVSGELGFPQTFSWIIITAFSIFIISKIWKAWKGYSEEP